jgi:hypothetical protein
MAPRKHVHFNVDERALAKLMHLQKYSVGTIARKLQDDRKSRGGGDGPSRSAVSRLVNSVSHRYDKAKPKGRPRLTRKKDDRKLISEIRKLKHRGPVRVAMSKAGGRWRSKNVSERTARRRLRERGYYSLAPRIKPEQSAEDRKKHGRGLSRTSHNLRFFIFVLVIFHST